MENQSSPPGYGRCSAKKHLAGAECVVFETATYTEEVVVEPMLRNIINRFSLFALAALLAFGCERADFRNGYSPGELEVLGDAKVYHLADGVMIEERRNGSKVYYLVESTVADYQLTLSPISKLTDLRFAVLLVRSAQPTRPLRHLLALKKLEFLHLASSCLKNKDELQQLVDDLPRLKRIEFNGGLTWPKKTA